MLMTMILDVRDTGETRHVAGASIEVRSMFRVTRRVLGAGIGKHNISAGRIEGTSGKAVARRDKQSTVNRKKASGRF